MPTPNPQTLQTVPLPLPGACIEGTYTLLRELGQGSFSVVFEAEQELLHRRVALKILRPEVVLIPGIADRFIREAQLSGALSSRHTATLYEIGLYQPRDDAQGLPFIAMELLHGETLNDLLERRGRLPREEALPLLNQLLASLSEAHTRGIVHRDIKPENIFLTQHGDQRVVKVLDFGIAKAVSGDWAAETRQQLTQTGFIFGTPAFMSPEQALGKVNIGPQADVYAAACVAYLMLTGDLLFPEQNATRLAYDHVYTAPDLSDELPPDLTRILAVALAKDPAHRYADAQAFANALQGAQPPRHADPTPQPTLPTLPPAPRAATPQHLGLFAGVALCTGIALALGVFLLAWPSVTSTSAPAAAAYTPLLHPQHAPDTQHAEAPSEAADPEALEAPTEATDPTPQHAETPTPPMAPPASQATAPPVKAPPTSAAARRIPRTPPGSAAPPQSTPASLHLACAQDDLQIFVDGGGPYTCGQRLSLPSGDYAVRAHARGQEVRRVVQLQPGSSTRVTLSIAPSNAASL